ncbi:hypothetical protein [Clostridium oryzae]|uniref:Uncharacterized protein n=1 Tax=Clostridium oryzae TaxID=1450648 RepID=A0A1V4INW6_9CLOT|nr:hypothetical protein [Clostridium oryzae]OPJ61559.1 hypothetical protein CLORY_22410 [Clostridium oryzae]
MIKLGQQIRFKQNRKIKTAKGDIIEVKKGDIARVVRKIDEETAEIVYITGAAKGLAQNIAMQVDDNINVEQIAKKIMDEING